jgi:CRISPR-associated protein Csb1
MTKSRILLDVLLEPAIGSRFQPTGFPDLGHAEFQRPNGAASLLVESEQSMANHLEGTLWDDAANEPIELLAALPHVRVVRADGSFVTSSRIEAHRLASAFVKGSTLDGANMIGVIKDRLGLSDDTLLDHRKIAREVFRLDPLALLHGVFFADGKWPGQPKIARAVTSFIEAEGVQRVESGGVKKDGVRHSIAEGSGGSSEGYGTVPFARTAWTAERIVASFSIDLKQIRSYGLGDAASALLADLAQFEIRSLLDDGMRLRTACDLVPTSRLIADKAGDPLSTLDELEARVRVGVAAVSELLDGASTIDVLWDGGKKKEKK